jgi:hypothetical protein
MFNILNAPAICRQRVEMPEHLSRIFKVLPLFLLLFPAVGCQKSLKDQPVSALTTAQSVSSNAVVNREYYIQPSKTDPAINTFNQNHFVSVNEGAVLKNSLFVFLPGSYRIPAESRVILRKAVSMGYHVIGLEYPNDKPVNPLCRNTNDITCHRRARQEVVDGIDRHPAINVNPANSILNRLKKLLLYLQKTYPSQNWGQYLTNGQINWSKIVISGHSQGGALAGIIGKFYPIKKVIMFSMIDYLTNGKVPDWEDLPANKSKFFGIINTNDELVPYNYVTLGWQHLGMSAYGKPLYIENHAPPYSNIHTLITYRTPNTTMIDKYHNGTAIDTYLIKNPDGTYLYAPAWTYLLSN